MDRVIAKKKWSTKRILTIVGIVGICALIFFAWYYTSGNKAECRYGKNHDQRGIKKGPFKEIIPVNGIVLPITTIYLDAIEGGRVEEKYVEDGAIMKKGNRFFG